LPYAVFDFAKTLNSAEILASPKIRVKNNEKAKIHIGNRDPVVTTTTTAGTDTQLSQTVQYVDSGIKLDIEPNVQLDGTVLAKITLEVSNAQRLNANDTTERLRSPDHHQCTDLAGAGRRVRTILAVYMKRTVRKTRRPSRSSAISPSLAVC